MIRLVKLHIKPDFCKDFERAFHSRKTTIQAFEGCREVRLLKHENGVYFTHSIWENQASLENYRASEFFIQTWKTVKPMFCEKAEAWSLHAV